VCIPLVAIIDKSLETGEVLNSLKLDHCHYCHVNKKSEKVIHKRLYHFYFWTTFSKANMDFDPSIARVITKVSNDTNTSLKNKQLTLDLFQDLSNAFDTINHMTLLAKLAHSGVRGVALEWFIRYIKQTEGNMYRSTIASHILIQ